MHHMRVMRILSDEDFKPIHSFPLEQLVIFAQDALNDMWYAWRKDFLADGNMTVFCLDEGVKAGPPVVVADDFDVFLVEVCMGDKVARMKLSKYRDGDEVEGDEDSDWSSDDEDEGEVELNRVFKPFPGSRG